MEHFFAYLKRFGNILPQDEAVVRRYAQRGNIPAGSFFLEPGQVCRKVGFITSGVFRVYVHNEEGDERTLGFPAEHKFIIDLESLQKQTATQECWEALTDVSFLYWERGDLQKMEQEICCWQAIVLPMMQHILISENQERVEMFNDDATVRYCKFLERYPDLVVRTPLRHIASYLGIAPQSLSRIRQQMGKG